MKMMNKLQLVIYHSRCLVDYVSNIYEAIIALNNYKKENLIAKE